MEPIVRARVEEYEQMVEFANSCFPWEHGIIEQRWCHVWGGHVKEPSEEYVRNFFLLKDRSEIVGMIAIVPLTLRFGGSTMQAGGVTAVATHPLYRGKGIMSALLARADQEMQQRGDVVSVLGGDRSRYAHFGWEQVGARCELHFPAKYLMQLPDPKGLPTRIRPGDTALKLEVLAQYDRGGFAFPRTEERLATLMRRKNAEFWGVHGSAGLTCYCAALDETVCEYGGAADELPGIVKYFAQVHDFSEIRILTPSRFGREEESLYRYAGGYRLLPVLSLKVLSLSRLAHCLLPALQDRAERRGTSNFALGLAIRETGEAITLYNRGGRLGLSREEPSAQLCLDRCDMARFLFGPFPEGIRSGAPTRLALEEILPFELLVSKIDMV
jgi:GNAT superfamily N-acetyltransferase